MNIQRFITHPTSCSTIGKIFVNGQYFCDSEEFSMSGVTLLDNSIVKLKLLQGCFKVNILFNNEYNMILPAICDDMDTILAWIVDKNTITIKGIEFTARNKNIRVGFFDSKIIMRCSQSTLKMLISMMKEACFRGERIDISCEYDQKEIESYYLDDLALRGFPV